MTEIVLRLLALSLCLLALVASPAAADDLADAQKQLGTMTLDDLVASAAPGSSKDSLKIKMKNGRTLTI